MSDNPVFDAAVVRLQGILARVNAGTISLPLEPSLTRKQEVLDRYQPIFAPEHLPELTAEEFRSFLLFSNNQHWSGLHRFWPKITADMPRLREALAVLLDQSRPIAERYDYTLARVRYLGRAIATPILQVVYPDKYGVWNTTSEGGLKAVDLWPRFERGEHEGSRYEKINGIFLRLANAVPVDLWTLDALWWYLLGEMGVQELIDESDGNTIAAETAFPIVPEVQRFGLERHLHDFLRDNWAQTDLGKEWKLHSEPGNLNAGYEYPTNVGRIDLLARHKSKPAWLVVELKRGQTGDETIGQVLRYMGWVKRQLAEPGEEVRGLILAHSVDKELAYAASMIAAVDLYEYEVKFLLRAAPEPEAAA